jgi:hypothetical protein
MVEIPAGPLMGEQQYIELNAALDAIKWSIAEIAKAKKAGIDMTAQEASALDAKKRIEQIKQVYFPNRP